MSSEDVAQLRDGLHALVSITASRAGSPPATPTHIVDALLDALVGLLPLTFAFVRVHDPAGGPAIESERGTTHGDEGLTSTSIGARGEIGSLLVASGDSAFTTETDRLVLQIAVNQAAVALQGIALDEAKRESGSIVDSIPGLVALLSATGDVEFTNRRLMEYTGQTFRELQGWSTSGVLHPEDFPHVAEVFGRSIAAGVPYDILQRIRRADGVYRWCQNNGFPLRDAAGRIVRWCVLLTDVDDLKRAEEALETRQRDLKLIIDTIPAVAWSSGPDGGASFFNQHYLDFVGLSFEQAKGWGWTVAVHPDDVERLAATWTRVLASGQAGDAEARFRRWDGEYHWFLLRANPLRDETGRIVQWYGVNTNIEVRKRAEEELRRSEAFLAQAQRLTQTGSLWWNVSTGAITWSEETYRVMEYPTTATPSLELVMNRVHPDDIALVGGMVERSAREGASMDFEHRLLMPNGSVKHVHVLLQNVAAASGEPQLVGALQDVTARRIGQEALNRLGAELARVSKMSTLSALTASIAHEINQPLQGILTNAGACRRMLDGTPPDIDGAREVTKRTLRDANRAAEVVSRLRALFSKHESALEALDLNEAVREVIALSSNDLHRNGIVLRSDLANDLIVAGDRIQLQQVILNLVRNASDAMSEISGRPRRLMVKTEREDGRRARVTIRDSGVGLSLEHIDSLFDAFHTTKTGGMGIGLFVSRSIVEAHQGRLWAEPNDGPGATFAFSIPLRNASPS